ncbi:Lrp/AsnC family transcriptional regulator [Candidatus Woesearchaeota archaeon]|nr:Lrp/AsnC family transcriptional regulator [Candidatus Woesearchaeota archaeon]
MLKLDEKDLLVLDQLRENAKLTTNQIAKRTAIPITTVHNRIKRMEQAGVITNYSIKLDHKKLGKCITAFILIKVVYRLPDGTRIEQTRLARELKAKDEVESVSIVAGESDIVITVRVKDVEHLNEFIVSHLRKIDGVDTTSTMIVLEEIG